MFTKYNRLFIFTIISLYVIVAQGQDSYYEGYLIKNDGDTVRGFIRFENQIEAQNECVFKINSSDQSVIYEPSDLKGYGLNNGATYFSKRITVNNITIRTFFLKQGLSGTISFYQYHLPKFSRYFVQKIGSENLLELKEERKLYIGILTFLMDDCDIDKANLNAVSFDPKEIKELINSYNVCQDPSISREIDIAETVEIEKGPKKSSMGVAIGMGLDDLKLSTSDPDFEYLQSLKLDNNVLPRIEFFYKSHLKGTKDKLAISLGAAYFLRKFTGDSERLLPPNITERNNILIQQHSFNVPIYFEYVLSNGKFYPFIKLGGEYRFTSQKTNLRFSENEIDDEIFIGEENVLNLNSNELAFGLGAGVFYNLSNEKVIGFELRYYSGNGIDNDGFSSTSQIQALISLGFQKVK